MPPTTLAFDSPEEFAAHVVVHLEEIERTPEWLSRKTGIPASTLRAHLKEKPARLTHVNYLRICDVLGLQVA